MNKIIHFIEFIIAKTALAIFGVMDFAKASNIGGLIGRFIGPKLKVTQIARENIRLAMPELSEERIEKIIIGMWDNLGRVITEYAHMAKLTSKQIDELVRIEGQENLDALIKTKGGFLMTGHLANWEMIAAVTFYRDCPLHVVYRKANNPYIDKMIYDIRRNHHISSSAKGPVGARQIIKSLKKGGRISMLVDQKQNDGIAVHFFGIPAMTAPAIANLALRYDYPIYPARIVRTDNNKFRYIFYPAIKVKKTGNERTDILALMTQINLILEGWIREYPEQWFWVHKRWPKDATRGENLPL